VVLAAEVAEAHRATTALLEMQTQEVAEVVHQAGEAQPLVVLVVLEL